MRRTIVFAVVLVGLLLAYQGPASDHWAKQLQHVNGTVGYQLRADGSDFKPVSDTVDLPDNGLAVTRAQSAAVLGLPDASRISLGESTTLQVGAFATTGFSRLTVVLDNGALRFDVSAPTGDAADYELVTKTLQADVRGAIGLLANAGDITMIGCLDCPPDSVTVTADNRTFTPRTGQYVAVTTAGAVATGLMNRRVLETFSSVDVPVDAP